MPTCPHRAPETRPGGVGDDQPALREELTRLKADHESLKRAVSHITAALYAVTGSAQLRQLGNHELARLLDAHERSLAARAPAPAAHPTELSDDRFAPVSNSSMNATLAEARNV